MKITKNQKTLIGTALSVAREQLSRQEQDVKAKELLADPVAQKALNYLQVKKGRNVTEVQNELQLTQPSTSTLLAQFRELKWVNVTPVGRNRYYSVDSENFTRFMNSL